MARNPRNRNRALPKIRTDDPAFQRWVRSVEEALHGLQKSGFEQTEQLSKALATRIEEVDKDLSEKVEPGLVTDDPPPAPTGFTVVGATISNIMNWDDPGFLGYAFTEVLRSSQDNLATAEVVTTTGGRVAVDQVGENVGVTYYYWIRFVKNYQGQLIRGPVNGTAGTPAEALALGDGGISGIAAEKIFAVQGTIAEALIGQAHINNAMIGNIIQSNNFLAGAAGWQINKNGNAEFRNIIARGDIEASSLKANTAMVNEGNIAQLAVDSIHIKDQAVTFPVSSHTGGLVSSDQGSTSWVTAQSISFVTTGAPVTVMYSSFCGVVGHYSPGGNGLYTPGGVQVRLIRNGVVIRNDKVMMTVGNQADSSILENSGVVSLIYLDQPQEGPVTYTIQFRGMQGGSYLGMISAGESAFVRMAARSIFAIETRK